MKTPPFLTGTALLFWGWQMQSLPVAIILALLFEGTYLITRRWSFSASDFKRIWDINVAIFMLVVVYLIATVKITSVILTICQWLPLILSPIALSQTYSLSDKIGIDTFFLLLRKKSEKTLNQKSYPSINLSYPYFAICLIATGSANIRTVWFYVGLIVLSAWALWFVRSKRNSPAVWIILFLLVSFMGYAGQAVLQNLQKDLENKVVKWFSGGETDPYKTHTAIGDIGALKESGQIILRVKQDEGSNFQTLLRRASYNLYDSSTWLSLKSSFHPVRPDLNGTTWRFQDAVSKNKITIYERLQKGKALLSLPMDTFQIENLPVLEMRKNRMGSVKVEQGPGLIKYMARFARDVSLGDPPNKFDLKISDKEALVINKIASELKLETKSPYAVLSTLNSFFQKNFKYSLFLGRKKLFTSPLENFLEHSRSGHCEYFATTTVLLLRKAGIPARYAVGYSVQEFSKTENLYIVRERHAHSWALAYIDGGWQDFDTTPASWVTTEQEAASIWEPFTDIWSRYMFLFLKWRWSEEKGEFQEYVLLLLIPLASILIWRFYFKKKSDRLKSVIKIRKRTGSDNSAPESDFYLILKQLKKRGYTHFTSEPLSVWINRISQKELPPAGTESLQQILELYYRLRFDPLGISDEKKKLLKSSVHLWLEQEHAKR